MESRKKRPFVFFIVELLVVCLTSTLGCSKGGNSDLPGQEGDLSPAAPTALTLFGNASLSSSPTLSWTAAVPVTGEISTYFMGVGTAEGEDDIVAFTDIGNVTTYQITSISPAISLNSLYYISIYAVDSDNRPSTSVSSDPWSTSMVTETGAYRIPESPYYLANCIDYVSSPYYESHGDGLYWIDPDGAGGNAPMRVYCDQTTDGGGWQLVLNYFHLGGTDPSNLPLTTSLPIPNADTLGDDGTLEMSSWGHASNSLLNTMAITDIRFYCESTLHPRVIHFKSSLSGAISYIQTGTGFMSPLASNFTGLTGHSAGLPGAATSYYAHRGDEALIAFPFYISGGDTWSVGRGSRWECDDYAAGPANSTIHKVWVR